MRIRNYVSIGLLAAVVLAATTLSFADSYVWDSGGGNSNWMTVANWDPDAPGGFNLGDDYTLSTGDAATSNSGETFTDMLTIGDGASLGFTFNNNGQITVGDLHLAGGTLLGTDYGQNIGGSLTADAGTHSYLQSTYNAYTWQNRIYATLNGSGDLEKTGTGNVSLDGSAGTFSGTITISAGTLRMNNTAALGNGTIEVDTATGNSGYAPLDLNVGISSGTINVNPGGRVALHQSVTADVTGGTFNLQGGTLWSHSGDHDTRIDGEINAVAGTKSYLSSNYSDVMGWQQRIYAKLMGSGDLEKVGIGRTELSSSTAGDYSGTITIAEGVLRFNNVNALANGTIEVENSTNYNNGALHLGVGFNSGTVNVNTDGIARLQQSLTADVTGGTFNLKGGTLYSHSGDHDTRIDGDINAVAGTKSYLSSNYSDVNGWQQRIYSRLMGSGDLEKVGIGRTSLSSTTGGDFSGTITIAEGVLRFDNVNALGNGTVEVENSTNYNNGAMQIGVGFNSGTVSVNTDGIARLSQSLTAVVTGDFNLAGGTLYSHSSDYDTRIDGTINAVAGTHSYISVNYSDLNWQQNILADIAGKGTLEKIGVGRALLNGDNSAFQGAWEVTLGRLALNVDDALGGGRASLYIADGAPDVYYLGSTTNTITGLTLGANTFGEGVYDITQSYASLEGPTINFADYFNGTGTLINQAYALVWDKGADGNWSEHEWITPPPDIPGANERAIIDTAYEVTVDGTYDVGYVTLENGGSLRVATGNSLTVGNDTTTEAGTSVVIEDGGTFTGDTGTIDTLKTEGGSPVIGSTDSLTVTNYDVQSNAGTTLVKTGAGDVNLGTVANALADTAVTVQGGTLRTSGATPLGAAGGTVTLDGGTFAVDHTAEVTVANPITITSSGGGLEATTEKVNYGAVTIPDGATLSTSGAGQTTVTGTTLSGSSATIASSNVHNVGTYADGAAAKTITIAGSGDDSATVFDNSSSGISAAATTFRVNSGTLEGIGADPLGGGAVVLNGGTLKVSLGGGVTGGMPTISGLNAHFDAGTGVTTSGSTVTNWADLSGSGHNATLAAGTPVLVTNALNGQPIVEFRGTDDYLNVADTLFSKEQYVVVRSPHATWNQHGAFLGRTSGRDSNYLMEYGNTGFHSNEYPDAVSLNGTVVDPTAPLGTITDWMLLKIDVNDDNPTLASYYLGRGDYSGMDFDVAEIWSFDRTLTASEENDLGGYLTQKYALTTSYTGGAPVPNVSGDLDMSSTDLTVESNSNLVAITDGKTDFGSLIVTSGVMTASGSPDGINFTDTTVAAGATGGVDGEVNVSAGPVAIGNGGTFVANGSVTADSITLSGASGGVTTDGTFNMGTYADGGAAKTLATGGTGVTVMDNSAGGISAATTTLRVEGGTLQATGGSGTDPIGGSQAIELAGGKLSMTGHASQAIVNNALLASLYYNPYSPDPNIRFERANSVLSQTAVMTVEDTGLGNSNGVGINYNGTFHTLLFPGMTQTDNFQVAWTGYFTAQEAGSHNFYSYWDDNANSFYIDLDDSGTFEDSERIDSNSWGGVGSITLAAGERHMVALGHAEATGGENVGWQITTPSMGWQNINPSAANQAGMWEYLGTTYAAIDMSTRTIRVEADSELELNTDFDVNYGALTFEDGVLTLSGTAPSHTFASTTIEAAATQVGFSTSGTVYTGAITGNDASATILKTGTGDLVLDQTNSGLGNATIDLQGGTLVANKTGTLASTTVQLSGGDLLLTSPGGAVDHAGTNISVTENSTITAGMGDYGVAGAIDASVGSAGGTLTVASSKYLTLESTDSYTLTINNDVSAASSSRVAVYDGAVTLAGTGTQQFYDLYVNRTAADGTGAGATLTVDNHMDVDNWLYVHNGGTLNTTGNITARNMDLKNGGTFTRTGDLTIDSGGQLYLRNHNVDMTGQTLTTAGARLEIADGGSLTHDDVISAQYIYGYHGTVSAPGFVVTEEYHLNNSSAVLNVTGTGNTLQAKNLNLYSGTVNMNGNSIDITSGGRLYIGGSSMNLQMTGTASLTTASNATVEIANGTLTTDKALDVGNLTIQSAGTLNRTGATAADRDVSVQSQLYVSGNTFDTTGSTLSVGNRIDLRSNASLVFDNDIVTNQLYMDNSSITPGGNMTFNGQVEVRNGSTLDMTGRTFTTSQTGTNMYIANSGSVLTVDSPVTVNILEISDNGQLIVNTGGVTFRDRTTLYRGTHPFDLAGSNGTSSYVQIRGGGLSDYNNDYDVHVTGTNTYEGRTEIHDATVLVADNGVGLPTTSTLRFHNGAIGGSGTFQREIGSADGGGVYWDSSGGFAGYGGDLTVTLAPQGGAIGDQLTWNSSTAGFRSQALYLGSSHSTHNVELTNDIDISGVQAPIYTYSLSTIGELSGHITGSGWINKYGGGTLRMANAANDFTGETRITRGTLEIGSNGEGLGTGFLRFYADNADSASGGAVLQGNGTFTRNIGTGAGEVYWQNYGGGFAARGGTFDITLEGGADLNWSDGNLGFASTRLFMNSSTADNVATITNNVNPNNGDRYFHVWDNPNSTADYAVMSGSMLAGNFYHLRKYGDGRLDLTHVDGTTGDTVRTTYDLYSNDTGELNIAGNAVIGRYFDIQNGSTVTTGGDMTVTRTGGGSWSYLREGTLDVTGNLTGIQYYNQYNNANNRLVVGGDMQVEQHTNMDGGTVDIGGSFTKGGGYYWYIRNGTQVTVGGDATSQHNVYIESQSSLDITGSGKTVAAESSVGSGNYSIYVQNGSASNLSTLSASGSTVASPNTLRGSHIYIHNHAGFSGNWTVDTKNYLEISSNAHIRPGAAAGEVGVIDVTTDFGGTGNMYMQNTSWYHWDLGIGGGDLINVDGTLTLNNTWNLVIGTAGGTSVLADEWDLFTYNGSLSGGLRSGTQFTGVNISLDSSVPASWNADAAEVHFDDVAGRVYLIGLEAFPSLVWDGTVGGWADGAGSDSRWDNGGTPGDVPDGTMEATINAGQSTVNTAGENALRVAVNGGGLVVASGGDLTVTNDVTVASGATLNVQGTLTADTLNTAGTTTIGGSTLHAQTINVTDGTTTITTNTTAPTINITGGNVVLAGGNLTGDAVEISGGVVNTGSKVVAATAGGTLTIGDHILTGTAGVSMRGADLLDSGTTRTMVLAGGTVTVAEGADSPGLMGSVFWNPGPNDRTPADLTGATFAHSDTRVFTGDKANTILTQAEDPNNNIVLNSQMYNYNAFPNFSGGEQFIVAVSGKFAARTTGTHNFTWNTDDASVLWMDLDGNGVFSADEEIGPYNWSATDSRVLEAGTKYDFIWMFREYGGGDNINWQFQEPGGSYAYIDPSDPAQTGLWLIGNLSEVLNMANTDVLVTTDTELDLSAFTDVAFGDLSLANEVTLTLIGDWDVIYDQASLWYGLGDIAMTYDVFGSGNVYLTGEGGEIIPEPATMALLAFGAIGLIARRKRK